MSEELKAVIESISSLGESGITAFIWYFVLTRVTDLLQTVVIIGGILLGVKAIARGISAGVKARK